jgi:hypothetical protein
MIRKGSWVVYKDEPAIVVEMSGGQALLHFVDELGDTVMASPTQTLEERVDVTKLVRATPEQIPMSRRSKVEKMVEEPVFIPTVLEVLEPPKEDVKE